MGSGYYVLGGNILNINKLKFRQKEPSDYRMVEELTREAFWNTHVPGGDEHYLVHIMRNSESFIKELDIVATTEKKLWGISCTPKLRYWG